MNSPYSTAALAAYASAVIHVAVLPFAPGAETMSMIVGAVIWAAFGYGLSSGIRVVAYLAFLMGLFGFNYALGAAMVYDGITSALFWLMFLADLAVVVFLFLPLWRSVRQTA